MTLTEETTEIIQERILNLQDRCDACQAQAFVQVNLLNGQLLFCGHHYHKYSEKLNNSAYEIVDEREHINAKPSQSSN